MSLDNQWGWQIVRVSSDGGRTTTIVKARGVTWAGLRSPF
jgi:hypothetical protein